jgi:UDP-glucose 4-epimerase
MAERVLITGGLGFIGVAAARELLARGHEVVLTRHRTSAPARDLTTANGAAAPRVVDLDLSQLLAVIDAVDDTRPSTIIHLATAGFRGSLIGELSTNVGGATNVLEAALRSATGRVIMASSIAVYAGLDRSPYHEADPLPVAASPHLPAVTKRVEELLALQWAAKSDLDVRIARLPIVYGPGYRSGFNLPSRVVRALVDRVPVEGPVEMPFDDLCYVDDVAGALADLVSAVDLHSRIFNLSSGRATTSQEIADVAGAHGADEQLVATIAIAGRTDADRFMDPTRTRSEVGWTSRIPYAEGFASYLEWTQTNRGRQ